MASELQFMPLTEEHLPFVRDYFTLSKRRMCNYDVADVYMWKDFMKTEIALREGMFFMKNIAFDVQVFPTPLGGDIPKCIGMIVEYCKNRGIPCIFAPVSKEDVEIICHSCTVTRVTERREWFDYVYNAHDMVTFAGRHYDGHRNHINHFLKSYPDCRFEELTDRNLPDALDFFEGFDVSSSDDLSDLKEEENKAALKMLKRYRQYDLLGGLLYAEGQIVALSLGEIQNDTLFILVERSDKRFKGCSQMIVREYARHFVNDNVKFLNRMEDDGNEGLRKSKIAYHPAFLIEKYMVEVETR